MTSATIETAGGRFHVDDTEGDAPPIVCLHSLFLDNRMFDDFTAEAEGEFRVVRPEYRGQGRSSPPTGDIITVEQCAGDMAAVMDELGVERAHLVATSMGGDVALRLAVYRPDLVASMAILGSSARPEPPDQLDQLMGLVDDLGEHGFTGERLDMLVTVMLGESTRTDPARSETVELWTERLTELPRSLVPAMTGVVKRRDARPLLVDITVPCLVISGEECFVRPPEWAHELADGLPDADLVMLPKVGHSPILEAPQETTTRVLQFFRARQP